MYKHTKLCMHQMYFWNLIQNPIPDDADDEFVDDSEDFSEDFSTTFVVPFRWWTMAFWEAVDFGCGFDWGFGCDLDWAAFLGTGFLASLSESVLLSGNQGHTFNDEKIIKDYQSLWAFYWEEMTYSNTFLKHPLSVYIIFSKYLGACMNKGKLWAYIKRPSIHVKDSIRFAEHLPITNLQTDW